MDDDDTDQPPFDLHKNIHYPTILIPPRVPQLQYSSRFTEYSTISTISTIPTIPSIIRAIFRSSPHCTLYTALPARKRISRHIACFRTFLARPLEVKVGTKRVVYTRYDCASKLLIHPRGTYYPDVPSPKGGRIRKGDESNKDHLHTTHQQRIEEFH